MIKYDHSLLHNIWCRQTLSCTMYRIVASLLLEMSLINILQLKVLFVLRFYDSLNLCRARSVYLTTLFLGRLSPLSG